MVPNFKNNDLVVTFNKSPLKLNDVVIAKAGNKLLIKRIKSIINEKFFLEGDNRDYQQSSCNETFLRNDILGKVLFKFSSSL